MYQITVDEIAVDVLRKAVKNLHLRIFPHEGRVLVTAPFFVRDAVIRRGLVRKMPWIKRKLAEFAERPRPLPQKMESGEVHYFLGEPYKLNIVEDHTKKSISCDKSSMSLHISATKSPSEVKGVLYQWYRKELMKLVPPLLDKWEPLIGVEITHWGIKQMKTKWGSCNVSRRRISLNLELVKKPPQCLEYVLVHELIHLLERLHNKRFWAFMDHFMPNWRVHRDTLNNHHA